MYGAHDFQLSDIQTCGERINQLRRQMVVHSGLYYEMDQSILTDKEFDDRACELAQLQASYPRVSAAVPYEKAAFKDFDGSTGFNLPFRNRRTRALAHTLLTKYKENNHGLPGYGLP